MTGLVAVTIESDQIVGWIIALAALLGAIAVVWRYVGRPLRAVVRIVTQEMTNDHGSSMKDDVHGIAVTVGQLSRDFDDLKTDFYNHLAERGPKSP